MARFTFVIDGDLRWSLVFVWMGVAGQRRRCPSIEARSSMYIVSQETATRIRIRAELVLEAFSLPVTGFSCVYTVDEPAWFTKSSTKAWKNRWRGGKSIGW